MIAQQVKMKASNLLTGRTKSQTKSQSKDLNPFGRGSSLSENPDNDDNEINNFGLSAGFNKNDEKDQIVFNDSNFNNNNRPAPPQPVPISGNYNLFNIFSSDFNLSIYI